MVTHYFVHVAAAGAVNLRKGIDSLTWGWKDEALDRRNSLYGNVTNRDLVRRIRNGDRLVLAHRGPDPRGLDETQYAEGTFREVTVFHVSSSLYESRQPIWSDETYPNRVDLVFEVQGQNWGADELGTAGMVALRRSANAKGVAIPAEVPVLPFQAALMAETTPDPIDPEDTGDAYALAVRRREQSRLRATKLGQRSVATCTLCERELPAHLLRAAHIKRRADCTPAERANLANVMLACVLGCDALFEAGHLTISPSGAIEAPLSLSGDLALAVQPLVGRRVTSDPQVLAFAAAHRTRHSG